MTPFGFSHRAVAVVVAVFAIGYLVLAFRMPEFTAVEVPVQPSTLPRWLGVALLVLAVLLFFQRGERGEDGERVPAAGAAGTRGGADDAGTATAPEPAETGEAAATDARPETAAGSAAAPASLGRIADVRLELAAFAGSIAGYILLFQPLGFLLSTALYVYAVAWYLGYRRHWVTALVSVGVPAALYFTMSDFLDVALPTGPLPL